MNPSGSDHDPNGPTDEEVERLIERLRRTYGSEVRWGRDGQDQSLLGACELPERLCRDPRNVFLALYVSKFDNLTTVFFEWDLIPEELQRLREIIAEEDFLYVPFTIFADPAVYRWEDLWEWHQSVIENRPSRTTPGEMKREQLWNNLFSYV